MDMLEFILSLFAIPLALWLFSRDNFSGQWHAFSERANAWAVIVGKWIGSISVKQLGRRVALLLIITGLILLFSFPTYPMAANVAAIIFYGGILAAWLFWPFHSQFIYLWFFGLVFACSLIGVVLDAAGVVDLGKLWNGMPPPSVLPGLTDLVQIENHGTRLLVVLVYLFVALWLVITVSAIIWVGSLALGMVTIVYVGRLLHTDWSPKPIFNLISAILIVTGIATIISHIIVRTSEGG